MTQAAPAGPATTTVPSGKTQRATYAVLAGVAAGTSLGIWLLMVFDEGRSAGGATIQMVAKFTNLTVLLIAVVAAWIASTHPVSSVRTIAHLSALVMAVVTAVVNATLLDPGLPGGWWGLIDLLQHYLLPAAMVAAWALLGPLVDISWSRLGSVLAIPFVWLLFALGRGAVASDYPYDFVDASERGWLLVAATVAAIMVGMVALAAGGVAIDHRRRATADDR